MSNKTANSNQTAAPVVQGVVMPLTDADKKALSRMPDGWFKPWELPYMISCPDYRCKRLEARGALISRVADEYYRREFCKA